MNTTSKSTLLYVLGAFIFFTSCDKQVKTEIPKDNATISARYTKLSKTQGPGMINTVYCSLQDKKGNLWFGTTSDGVFCYDGNFFTNFTIKDGLNSNSIFSMLEDKKGTIWIGTDSGLSHYDGKTFTNIPLTFTSGNYLYPSASPNNKPFKGNMVTSILEDKSGKLWFGTVTGVYCYDGAAFTLFLDDPRVININGLTLRLIHHMLEDEHGNIWFTTKMEGVCCYNGNSIISHKPNGERWFRGLLEDKEGNIWVERRYKGVCRYDGENFTNILQNGRFDSCTVKSIKQDKSGNIWFSTAAGDWFKREAMGGVWVYDGTFFKNFSTKDGLTNNDVSCILEDKSGNLWFGTNDNGLCRFDGKTFTSFSE